MTIQDDIARARSDQSKILRLNQRGLKKLPKELFALKHLEQLHLNENELTFLPSEIGQLTNLKSLILTDNQLSFLPPEIGQLINLELLDLAGNNLSSLPSEIANLTKLDQIDLRRNQLPIPPELFEQKPIGPTYESQGIPSGLSLQLRQVLLECGYLDTDMELSVSFIDSRISIWRTLLPQSDNRASRVEKLIDFLHDRYNNSQENALVLLLHVLADRTDPNDACHHRLTEMAIYLERELQVASTAIETPESTFLSSSISAKLIIKYCLQNQQDRRPLNEAKIILVGQGGVGKTSLVKRIIDNDFDPHETKTDGISVRKWIRHIDSEFIYLRLWDFGGQEIMHATHQFFLTRRSLYLLVIDARKGEQEGNLEYWLKIIQSFADDAPIIVVINKTDEHKLKLDKKSLSQKYSTIKAFIETSCQTGGGIEQLIKAIDHEIKRMEHVGNVWFNSWFDVKARLENLEKDFVSFDYFANICSEVGIQDENTQFVLLSFLHDLGVILNFRDDPRLEYTNVLKPAWVTDAVYKILNSVEMFDSSGILTRRDLRQILDAKRYPSSKFNFIFGMMRRFELCFLLESPHEEAYLIPELLPKEEPDNSGWVEEKNSLNFLYKYQILPTSIISRFIVRMKLYHETYWRSGVILKYQENRARIVADIEDTTISISVIGDFKTRREFLGIIRSQLNYINSTVPRVESKEYVPIPNHPGIYEAYDHLLMLEQEGEISFYPRGLRKRINIRQILDGIEPPVARGTPGIPPEILNRLRNLLKDCEQFLANNKLHDLFVNSNISPWREGVSQLDNPASRVQSLINFLHNKYRSDNKKNALILFLHALNDTINPEDIRHLIMIEIAEELEPILQIHD